MAQVYAIQRCLLYCLSSTLFSDGKRCFGLLLKHGFKACKKHICFHVCGLPFFKEETAANEQMRSDNVRHSHFLCKCLPVLACQSVLMEKNKIVIWRYLTLTHERLDLEWPSAPGNQSLWFRRKTVRKNH